MQTTRENLPCSNRLLTLKPNIPQQVSSAEVGVLQMPLKIFLFPLHRAEPAASFLAPGFHSPSFISVSFLQEQLLGSLPGKFPESLGSCLGLICHFSLCTLPGHWQLNPIPGEPPDLTACSPLCPQCPYPLLYLANSFPSSRF